MTDESLLVGPNAGVCEFAPVQRPDFSFRQPGEVRVGPRPRLPIQDYAPMLLIFH